jgi:hypothetical protein
MRTFYRSAVNVIQLMDAQISMIHATLERQSKPQSNFNSGASLITDLYNYL